ncbi:MAG: cell division protein FtsQ [Prevotella sp.]|nr:cell division protein FtsQ [Prevotella sp.]MCD8305258.1 cell division protein FtsQ [Prevotella sp.]
MKGAAKKIFIIFVDVMLAAYIVVALCAFHDGNSGKKARCNGVTVVIADGTTHGFIDRNEIVARVKKAGLYPTGLPLDSVNCRTIEEALLATPFIRTAQCYATIDGMVNIEITQRMPVVRIKASNNDDFYIDDKNCIMPITNYTSDIIIATGAIDRTYATTRLGPLARALSDDDFARNLFQQINITPSGRVELIPQVGGSVISLGILPSEREENVEDFVRRKMATLRTFLQYGLSKAGWNKYSVINLEFDNQIVCRRRQGKEFF